MRTVYKYELTPKNNNGLTEPVLIPYDAKFLSVGSQGSGIFLWAEVDSESKLTEFVFEVFGTGHEISENMGTDREFIGTVFLYDGNLVFHVYHRKN